MFTVTTTADSGPGSLRQAILDANANPGEDRIEFVIGEGTQTIRPLTALPSVSTPVEIDGTTQPGYQGTPLIELDGSAGSAVLGLSLRDSTVRGLAINRFRVGISLTSNNLVVGNYLGTDVTGTRALPNANVGIAVTGSRNRIGGTDPKDRNLLSGNGTNPVGAGISFETGSADNVVQGNFIGTDVTGTQPLPNRVGIRLSANPGAFVRNTLIGGAEPGAGNLISGNDWQGIWASNLGAGGSVVGTRIQGNYIGTDASGTNPLGNREGIQLSIGAQSLIGGLELGAGNLVAFNRSTGILPGEFSDTVQGNVIYGNAGTGLSVSGPNALVQGNWVVGNAGVGLGVSAVDLGVSALNALVQGNWVVGNEGGGIRLGRSATGSLVGGTADGEGNVVAYNGGPGLLVDSGVRVRLSGNSLVGNAGLGIELRNGANNGQNAPEVAGSALFGGRLYAGGWLLSRPKEPFELEFFASSACDESDFGEGELFLGSRQAQTDEDGVAVFVEEFAAEVPAGWVVTATATDSQGNTSTFSACAEVQKFGAPGGGSGGLGDLLAALLAGELRGTKKAASPSFMG